jgi:hypothetical protein
MGKNSQDRSKYKPSSSADAANSLAQSDNLGSLGTSTLVSWLTSADSASTTTSNAEGEVLVVLKKFSKVVLQFILKSFLLFNTDFTSFFFPLLTLFRRTQKHDVKHWLS